MTPIWSFIVAGLGFSLVLISVGLPTVAGHPWSDDWSQAVARLLIFVGGILIGAAR